MSCSDLSSLSLGAPAVKTSHLLPQLSTCCCHDAFVKAGSFKSSHHRSDLHKDLIHPIWTGHASSLHVPRPPVHNSPADFDTHLVQMQLATVIILFLPYLHDVLHSSLPLTVFLVADYAGQLLPMHWTPWMDSMESIHGVKAARSLPDPDPNASQRATAEAAGHHFTLSPNHWCILSTLKQWVDRIVIPDFESTCQSKNLDPADAVCNLVTRFIGWPDMIVCIATCILSSRYGYLITSQALDWLRLCARSLITIITVHVVNAFS